LGHTAGFDVSLLVLLLLVSVVVLCSGYDHQ